MYRRICHVSGRVFAYNHALLDSVLVDNKERKFSRNNAPVMSV